MKQINTGKAELLLIKVPEGATQFKVLYWPVGDIFFYELKGEGKQQILPKPKNSWVPLALSTELTEEQCMEILEHTLANGFKGNKYPVYLDYRLAPLDYSIWSGTIALQYFLEANECFTKNPHGDKAPKYDVSKADGSATKYLEWKKAEENTGSWLILKKV